MFMYVIFENTEVFNLLQVFFISPENGPLEKVAEIMEVPIQNYGWLATCHKTGFNCRHTERNPPPPHSLTSES